jgi:phosphoglycolate phosphatase-like HAD superfamily hydrolase
LLHDHPVDPSHVYVVGDTPLDVAAARAAGAVSVAVASGSYSVDALAATGADHVLLSLASPFPGLDAAL